MKVVDTNILLNAVNEDAPDCQRCCACLEALANGDQTWTITWGIYYEFLRVATHPRIFPKPLTLSEALDFIQPLMTRPNCLILTETPEHATAFNECMTESPRLVGNILHDFHTAVLVREHGVDTVLTFDRDFRAFPWVEVEVP